MSPFSEEPRSYSETRKRSSSAYVKFTEEYRVVLRVLDPNARTVWKHWLPMANAGKGFGAVCPNVSSQVRPCPVEKLIDANPTDDSLVGMKARRRFIVNVLDRTPYTTCEACGNETPGKSAKSKKVCAFCDADVSKNDWKPLNAVKVLEGGPNLFNKTLNAIEKLQKEELGAEITDYDIIFSTQGKGRDREIIGTPGAVAPLADDATLDSEGNPQQLWSLDKLTEPSSIEEIEALLEGATMAEINAIRGVE